jgi:hypothetical protein
MQMKKEVVSPAVLLPVTLAILTIIALILVNHI